jgi:hypothetical protein
VRPHLQLFLHVAGAIALFGATATVATIGFAARHRAEQAQLARAALATLLLVAIPAWVVMLVFGSWTKSKEGIPGSIDWLRIGSDVAGAGIPLLLAATGVAYSWARRPGGRWQPSAVGLLASGYLAALAVAWWVMTAKTGF